MKKLFLLSAVFVLLVIQVSSAQSDREPSVVVPKEQLGCCIASDGICTDVSQLVLQQPLLDPSGFEFSPQQLCDKFTKIRTSLNFGEFFSDQFCNQIDRCLGCCLYNGQIQSENICIVNVTKSIKTSSNYLNKVWDPSIKNPSQCKNSMLDTDEDGVLDYDEGLVGSDIENEYSVPSDRDGDDITNDRDNCPDKPNGNIDVRNKDDINKRRCPGYPNDQSMCNQEDFDQDGVGDACDNCRIVNNPVDEETGKQADIDKDGVGDLCDNCRTVENPDQEDKKEPFCPQIIRNIGYGLDPLCGDACNSKFIGSQTAVGGEISVPTGGSDQETDCNKNSDVGKLQNSGNCCRECTKKGSYWKVINSNECINLGKMPGNSILSSNPLDISTSVINCEQGQVEWIVESSQNDLCGESQPVLLFGPNNGQRAEGACYRCISDIKSWYGWDAVDSSKCEEIKTSFIQPNNQDFFAFLGPVGDFLANLFQPILAFFSGPKVEFVPTDNSNELVAVKITGPTFPSDTKVQTNVQVNVVKDTDADGTSDSIDNCPVKANSDQKDSDFDLVGDTCDNCLNVYNPDQKDTDRDSVGDICDQAPEDPTEYTVVTSNTVPGLSDSDGDTVADIYDNCPSVSNANQEDIDADGYGNVCDETPSGEEYTVIPGSENSG